MDTKEQLKETSEELKESIKDTFSNLKDYGKAVATHTGATIKQGVSNLKERFLSFKEGVKHKASTSKAKLGTIKTTALEKLNPHNLDVKFRDLVEKVEIAGLEVAHKGKEAVIEAKDKVVDLYATQAANYYLRQEQKEQERLEQERIREEERAREAEIKENSKEHKIGMKEALKEQDRLQREARRLQFRENVKEKVSSAKGKLGKIKTSLLEKLNPHNLDVKFRDLVERVEIAGLEVAHKGKEAVIAAKDKVVDLYATQAANYYLRQEEKEQERLERERIREEERAREEAIKANSKEHKIGMKEALKEQDRLQREARRLQFRENMAQKTNSFKSKLGTIKNSLLQKLRSAKDKVTDFFAEKAANYYLKQEERQIEKEFKLAQKEAEREEIEKAKARIRERKKDVAYALNAEEREMYEQKHLDNQARKEELMRQLFGEKEEEQVVRTARAM